MGPTSVFLLLVMAAALATQEIQGQMDMELTGRAVQVELQEMQVPQVLQATQATLEIMVHLMLGIMA
jgi:hypothetical protein